MRRMAVLIAPSTDAPATLILSVFLISLVAICAYYFIWRNK